MLDYGVKVIELSDKPFFERAYSSLKMPLADQDFSMIYIWDKLINIRWFPLNGNLCAFADFGGSTVLWGPVIGGGKLKETLSACFSLLGKDGRLCYLPEELYDEYSELEGFKLVSQSQEYIYSVKDLVELKGGRYGKKRNLINHFLSNYRPMVEVFDSERHRKGCLELLDVWKRQKAESSSINKSIRFQFNTEARLARETVILADELGLKGLVVVIDGRIQGMTFGSLLNADTCSVIVEKTNLMFKGLPEFIFSEFLKRCWGSCTFVNAQEDMGVEYLKSAKMSYHPVRLLKSYMVVRDEAD